MMSRDFNDELLCKLLTYTLTDNNMKAATNGLQKVIVDMDRRIFKTHHTPHFRPR